MFCSFGKDAKVQKDFKKAQILTESVYNLISQPEVLLPTSTRYRSKFNASIKEFYDSIKSSHKTMGYFKTPLTPPKEFLKKHSKEPKNESKPFSYPDIERRRPPIPKLKDMPPPPSGPTKNFVKENARNVIRSAPRKPQRRVADTNKGDMVELEFSGLVPKFSMKEEFGKTPKYLVRRQVDMDYSRKAYQDYIHEQNTKGAPHKLTNEERQDLITGLKDNWTELQHEYLGLSLITDTIRKKVIKEKLEDRLHAVEQDIKLLERHEEIYILNPEDK